jgi:hypothetical protein
MSELLSKLQSSTKSRQTRCGFSLLADSLDAAEWDQICLIMDEMRNRQAEAKSKGHTSSWLGRILREHGYSVSDNTIYRHVKRNCCCERS